MIIDVRESADMDQTKMTDTPFIPFSELPDRLDEIPTDLTVVLVSPQEKASVESADYLRAQGFTNVHNMAGGVEAWAAAGHLTE